MNASNATSGTVTMQHSLYGAISTMCPDLPDSDLAAVAAQFFNPVDTMATAYSIVLVMSFVPFCKVLSIIFGKLAALDCMRPVLSQIDKVSLWVLSKIKCLAKPTCISKHNKYASRSKVVAVERTAAAVEEQTEECKAAVEEKNEELKATLDGKAEELNSSLNGHMPSKDDSSPDLRVILCFLQVPMFLAALVHYYGSVVPGGVSWQCTALFWAAAPMAKQIAVPMWAILMPAGQVAHWLLNRHKTPIQQTGIAAGTPPLPMNGATLILMCVAAAFFLAWVATSSPVIFGIAAYLP